MGQLYKIFDRYPWIITAILLIALGTAIYREAVKSSQVMPPVQFFHRLTHVNHSRIKTQADITSLNVKLPDLKALLVLFQPGHQLPPSGLTNYINYYEELKETFPLTPEHHHILGVLYFYDEQEQKAEESFKHAIALNPKYFLSLFNLAIMNTQKKNYSEALRYLNDARQSDPQTNLKDILSSKMFRQLLGNSPEFMNAVQSNLKIKYESIGVLAGENLLGLAKIAEKKNQREQAAALYNDAQQLNPRAIKSSMYSVDLF